MGHSSYGEYHSAYETALLCQYWNFHHLVSTRQHISNKNWVWIIKDHIDFHYGHGITASAASVSAFPLKAALINILL